MLKRIGIVAWWLGTIAILLGLFVPTASLIVQSRNPMPSVSSQVQWDLIPPTNAVHPQSRFVDIPAQRDPIPPTNPVRPPPGYVLDQSPPAQEPGQPKTMANVFDQFDATTPQPQRSFWLAEHWQSDYTVMIVVGFLAGLPLWALAFILGGSFWKPPKI